MVGARQPWEQRPGPQGGGLPGSEPPHTHTHPPPLLQFEIRQLRAHLAQQGLDLAAEREAALLAPQVLGRQRSRDQVRGDTAARSGVEALPPPAGKPLRGSLELERVPFRDCAPLAHDLG